MASAWKLQDAKARFSEVVRLALTEGPQSVTVRGEAAVTVLSTTEFERISSSARLRTGFDLMEALRSDSSCDIPLPRIDMPATLKDVLSFDD